MFNLSVNIKRSFKTSDHYFHNLPICLVAKLSAAICYGREYLVIITQQANSTQIQSFYPYAAHILPFQSNSKASFQLFFISALSIGATKLDLYPIVFQVTAIWMFRLHFIQLLHYSPCFCCTSRHLCSSSSFWLLWKRL